MALVGAGVQIGQAIVLVISVPPMAAGAANDTPSNQVCQMLNRFAQRTTIVLEESRLCTVRVLQPGTRLFPVKQFCPQSSQFRTCFTVEVHVVCAC